MPQAAHIAFAKDVAGNIAAASAFFVSQRSEYFCVACDKPLQRVSGAHQYPHFVHAIKTRCRHSAQQALRAAAQHVLCDARFMRAPAPPGHVPPQGTSSLPRESGTRSTGLLVNWAESARDVTVTNAPVDFLATDSQFGQVAVRLVVPGLESGDTLSLPKDIPVLEVTLPLPAEVHGFADLRQALLHNVANKTWLVAPQEALLVSAATHDVEEAETALPAEAEAAAAAEHGRPWHRAISFADNAIYRQLAPAQKLEALERLMEVPREKWPAEADIEVDNEDVFGVDRRLWQADLLARFVLQATPRSAVSDFSAEAALDWLKERYAVTPTFPDAALYATKTYLSELIARGILSYRDSRTGVYMVLRQQTDEREGLVWFPRANLSASQLRTLARHLDMHIPVGMVQAILDSFDDGHPVGTVSEFVTAISRLVHASPKQVTALLMDAHLVMEAGSTVDALQQSLF